MKILKIIKKVEISIKKENFWYLLRFIYYKNLDKLLNIIYDHSIIQTLN